MRRKEMEPHRPGGCEVLLPRIVKRDIEVRPVVESRAGDGAVVNRETERLHEMERNAQPDAEAAYRTRVVRYLRAEKDD